MRITYEPHVWRVLIYFVVIESISCYFDNLPSGRLVHQMRVQAITKARQRRILLATLTTDDYIKMDADGDGHISREEFICRTLVQQVNVAFFMLRDDP